MNLTHALRLTLLFPAIMLASCASTKKEPLTRPEIVPAFVWGSEPASLEGREHTPRYVTIHHAGVAWKPTDDPVAKLKGLQSWGKRDKDWPDIPYHFMIAPDGQIFEARSTDYEPETNTNFDVNGHLNVHLWGNFEEQRVSQEQLESAVEISAWLIREHNLEDPQIGGHLDRLSDGGTSCPGKDMYRYIEDGTFTEWVETRLMDKEAEVELKEPMEDGPVVFIGE